MRARRISPLATLALLVGLVLAAAAPPASIKAQAAPTVAYVYNTDTAARDSFVAALELRGLDVVPLTLDEAALLGDGFGDFLAVIIADDTGSSGDPFVWLGSRTAVSSIATFARSIVSIGYGAQFFDQHGGLDIGWGPSWITSGDGVFAVEPGAGYWGDPNVVPVPAGGVVKLYNLTTPMLAVNNPAANGVLRIGRQADDQAHYPLAAQPFSGQFGVQCNVMWGFRRSPAAMTGAGRDLLENLLRGDPCASQARPADLSISKSDKPDPATVGQPLTYTLTVSNAGPAPAPDVLVEDTLPADVTLVSATPSLGSCARARAVVRCSLGALASGAGATVAIVVKPDAEGQIVNSATVSSGAPDPNRANNSAQQATVVQQPATFKPILALPYKEIFVGPIFTLLNEDLSIHGIEITQGIQCFDTSLGLSDCSNNSLPQVTRKSTAARIYLRYSGPATGKNNVPVRLVITDANGVVQNVNVSGRALPAISRGSAANSANVFFVVNFGSTTAVKFHAIVDPNGTMAETNEANNRFPASGDVTISFSPRRTMRIVSQRLDYHPSGYTSTRQAGGWAVNGGAAQWLEQLLPIQNGGITHQVKSGYLDWTTSISGEGQHTLIKSLNTRWIMETVFPWLFGAGAFTGARHVYGWVPGAAWGGGHADMPVYPHAGGLGVVGIGTDTPGTSTDSPGAGALIFGHELVHDYDVKHTDVSGDCGSNDDTSDFPYASAGIQEFGFNTTTGRVYDPSNTHDLMSYCPAGGSVNGWISPFTWSRMYNKLAPSGPAALAAAPQAVGPALIVNAVLDNPAVPGGASALGTAYRVDADVPTSPPPAGDYAVVLKDAGDAVLATTPFNVSFQSEYSGTGLAHSHDPGVAPHIEAVGDPADTSVASVSLTVPWVEGTAKVVLEKGGVVLDVRDVSPNPPAVEVTSPSAPATWAPGTTETITWAASDPDGGTLTYSLFYAADGVSWQLLAEGITGTSFDVSVDALAGGDQARFRVVASDGVNIGDDESAPVSVPNKAPVPLIASPAATADVPVGDLLVLEGFAGDLEDGQLLDAALTWSDDRQGVLGTGTSLPVAGLLPGAHTITLTATDSGGQSASATATIYVGARVFVPLAGK